MYLDNISQSVAILADISEVYIEAVLLQLMDFCWQASKNFELRYITQTFQKHACTLKPSNNPYFQNIASFLRLIRSVVKAKVLQTRASLINSRSVVNRFYGGIKHAMP